MLPTAEKSKLLVQFGQNIGHERRKLGISQEKLAEFAGLHRTYIGMIERGEKNITLLNINNIARGLGLNLIDLFKF